MKAIKIAALAAVLASTSALAETDKTGFYIGGALNQVKVSGDGDGSLDGIGFGAYGGYNFNEWFGLESNLFASGDLGEDGVDVGAGAWTFTPKFTVQFNDMFSGFAKVGLASMVVTVDSGLVDTDFTGTGFTWGLGLNAAVNEHLNIRLSYDRSSGDLDGDWADDLDTDISQIALGVHYQF
ncbi:porin family protein [Shewanella sedimentimangrovi]|uniref:Porin family protein n=1 Tax=Shewanella sedimentimangrovi TaxID=2814293 RepID=A0ABX7R2N5_9GAMM|nr:porin family protein [Shewanella sedimentimangrovi]QSX37086.1 porin family protein [Shewanella sedimentimangrovi]